MRARGAVRGGARSVSAEVELEPGEYDVLPKILAQHDPSRPLVEDVVREYAQKNPQKLRQIGVNHDVANAKGSRWSSWPRWMTRLSRIMVQTQNRSRSRRKKSPRKPALPKMDRLLWTRPARRAKTRPIQLGLPSPRKKKPRRPKWSNIRQLRLVNMRRSKRRKRPKHPRPTRPLANLAPNLEVSQSPTRRKDEKEEKKDEKEEKKDKKEEKKDEKEEKEEKRDDEIDDEDDDGVDEPWNAVCVIGLRVYSKNAEAVIDVVSPKDSEGASLQIDTKTSAGATT